MVDPVEMHFSQLNRVVPVQGLRVADIGCGKGELARRMIEAGADVTGIECGESQLAAARAADPGRADRYLEGTGEAIPLADNAVDLVVFSYSLHHVPVAAMPQALAEAHRVLREGARLCVIEPLAEGEMYALDGLIDDEADVRAAAQAALAACDEFREVHRETYDTHYTYPTVDDLIAEMTAIDPGRQQRAVVNDSLLRSIFVSTGEAVDDGRRFAQPNLVQVFARD